MSEHKIKIKKKYYDAVLSGEKTFEIRKNDRDYQVGDIIHFVPIADDCNMIIPHNQNEYKITYVFHGGEYGLEKGYCVFGIAPTIEAAPAVGRDKDIDEFAEEMKRYIAVEYGLTDISLRDIDRIAEQMKGGAE